MKGVKVGVIILVVLVAGMASELVKEKLARDSFSKECMQSQGGFARYLQAIRSNDQTACQSLDGIFKPRCKAIVASDPSLCAKNDFDCEAIAGKDIARCAEPVCKAWVSSDKSYCAQLGKDQDWCTHIVDLDSSYFAPSQAKCDEQAKQSIRTIL